MNFFTPAKFIKKILFQTLPDTMVTKYTGWEKNKPIEDDVPKFARRDLPFANWWGEKQIECTETQAFYMLYSTLSDQPYETLKLKSENCGITSKKNFPNHLNNDDIKCWARQSYWSLSEAVLLTQGIVPDEEGEILKHYYNIGEVVRELTMQPIRDYDERLELLKRHMISSPISDKVEPVVALKFFDKRNLSIPSALVKEVSSIGENSKTLKTAHSTGDFDLQPNKKLSFVCVIGAMALDYYKISSSSDKNKIRDFLSDYQKRVSGHDMKKVEQTLLDAVEYFHDSKRGKKLKNPSNFNAKILKNITGVLAVDGDGFETGKRSNRVQDLKTIMNLHGIDKDLKNIRRRLNEGFTSLP